MLQKIFFLKDISENKDSHGITAELCVDTLYNKKPNPIIIDTKVTDYDVLEKNENLLGVLYEKEDSVNEYNIETSNQKEFHL